MVSLRAAAGCLGIRGGFSVVRDFFGHRQLKPQSSFTSLSVLRQVRAIQGKHIHVNFIQVGAEQFTADVEEYTDRGLVDLREVYAEVSLGIGRVEHYSLPLAEAEPFTVIDSNAEFKELTRQWTVPNNGIDIFLVMEIDGSRGKSPIGGPCDKDKKGYTGLVAATPNVLLGRVLAHEIGHYLGLKHRKGEGQKGNLMHEHEYWMGDFLDGEQAGKMRSHCMVRGGCSGLGP